MQKFEPFQKVMVRTEPGCIWSCDLYSHIDVSTTRIHYVLSGGTYTDENILPYAENEHLLGTTESPAPKWEPKPGELVAVKKEGFDHWVMAQFKCKGIEGGFIVTNRDDRRTDGSIFDYCEPLRKHFTIPEE